MDSVNIGVVLFVILCVYIFSKLTNLQENWGTSPGTLIQLASNSGYYPYYRYGYGYRYPYYIYKYPYHLYYPMGYYPLKYENYNYGLY
jgi:hypothetical protein